MDVFNLLCNQYFLVGRLIVSVMRNVCGKFIWSEFWTIYRTGVSLSLHVEILRDIRLCEISTFFSIWINLPVCRNVPMGIGKNCVCILLVSVCWPVLAFIFNYHLNDYGEFKAAVNNCFISYGNDLNRLRSIVINTYLRPV